MDGGGTLVTCTSWVPFHRTVEDWWLAPLAALPWHSSDVGQSVLLGLPPGT